MINFLFVISFYVFVIFAVISVVTKIRKKKTKPFLIVALISLAIYFICAVMNPQDEKKTVQEQQTTANNANKKIEALDVMVTNTPTPTNTPVPTKAQETTEKPEAEPTEGATEGETEAAIQTPSLTQTEISEPEEAKIDYDDLQQIFLEMTLNTTENDILNFISEHSLVYTAVDYNGYWDVTSDIRKYKLGYDDDVVAQSQATAGDYLCITFDVENEALLYAEYFDFKTLKTAILYNYGSRWIFRENVPNNNNTGYYYIPGDGSVGVTITLHGDTNYGDSRKSCYHAAATAEETLEAVMSDEKETTNIEYDNLQNIFLDITLSTTEDDVLKFIDQYGLKYTKEDYSGAADMPDHIKYKIAYDEDVARQRHARSGDNMEISFSSDSGEFMEVEYGGAVFYNFGSLFNEKDPNNAYTGYYYGGSWDDYGGITIIYQNGHTEATGYYKAWSAEEALANIMIY